MFTLAHLADPLLKLRGFSWWWRVVCPWMRQKDLEKNCDSCHEGGWIFWLFTVVNVYSLSQLIVFPHCKWWSCTPLYQYLKWMKIDIDQLNTPAPIVLPPRYSWTITLIMPFWEWMKCSKHTISHVGLPIHCDSHFMPHADSWMTCASQQIMYSILYLNQVILRVVDSRKWQHVWDDCDVNLSQLIRLWRSRFLLDIS